MGKRDSVDHEAREWIVALLRRHMETNGYTAADVARRTGLSESTLSNYLGGRVKGLGLDAVLKLHRLLPIPGDLLLGPPDWRLKGIRARGPEPAPHREAVRHGSSR